MKYEWCVQAILWYLPWSMKNYTCSGEDSGSAEQVFFLELKPIPSWNWQTSMFWSIVWNYNDSDSGSGSFPLGVGTSNWASSSAGITNSTFGTNSSIGAGSTAGTGTNSTFGTDSSIGAGSTAGTDSTVESAPVQALLAKQDCGSGSYSGSGKNRPSSSFSGYKSKTRRARTLILGSWHFWHLIPQYGVQDILVRTLFMYCWIHFEKKPTHGSGVTGLGPSACKSSPFSKTRTFQLLWSQALGPSRAMSLISIVKTSWNEEYQIFECIFEIHSILQYMILLSINWTGN